MFQNVCKIIYDCEGYTKSVLVLMQLYGPGPETGTTEKPFPPLLAVWFLARRSCP